MIDFKNDIYLELVQVHDSVFEDAIAPMLLENEQILFVYHTMQNGVLFTDKRIFFIGTVGLIEKKRDITAVSYRRMLAFSLETGKKKRNQQRH